MKKLLQRWVTQFQEWGGKFFDAYVCAAAPSNATLNGVLDEEVRVRAVALQEKKVSEKEIQDRLLRRAERMALQRYPRISLKALAKALYESGSKRSRCNAYHLARQHDLIIGRCRRNPKFVLFSKEKLREFILEFRTGHPVLRRAA